MQKEIIEGNKLIAEFMGYKLARCNNGLAWESPHSRAIDDVFKLHGRLWHEMDTHYKWHLSWDWLMPVIRRCIDSCATKTVDELTPLEFETAGKVINMYVGESIGMAYYYVVDYLKAYYYAKNISSNEKPE